ncbi:MAG: hypothetical protein JNK82_18615 [Myxococcaceae bacterium]|nr:hypothetical protein [Myxococcaceae bacterium]
MTSRLVVLLLVGCGQLSPAMPPPPLPLPPLPSPVDGGEPQPEPAPTALALSVGTGRRGAMLPFVDGQVLSLQRGCQGSQHIFTSFRVVNAAAGLVRVKVRVVRTSDGETVSVPVDVRLPLEPDPLQMPEAAVITGLTPVVEVPRDVLGKEVEVRVELEDAGGAMASGSMRGTAQWGPDSCG